MTTSDYLNATNTLLDIVVDNCNAPDREAANLRHAQVIATQAVAAAIERLAVAVENFQR
jgi:hypothetical protein